MEQQLRPSIGHEPNGLHVPSVVASVPALLPWVGVLFMLLRWMGHLSAGTIQLGEGTSWGTLVVLLVVLPLTGILFAGAVFLAAWRGKQNLRWQVLSFVLGIVMLLMTVGD